MRATDAWLTMCWTNDGAQLNRDMPEIAFVLGKDGGERVIRTIGGPSCVAKNRYSLPEELPLSWPALMAAFLTKPPLTQAN